MAFAPDHLSGNDDLDVFSAAQMAIKALEQDNRPYRFVDGDTVEVWQILNDGELRLLATAALSGVVLMAGAASQQEMARSLAQMFVVVRT